MQIYRLNDQRRTAIPTPKAKGQLELAESLHPDHYTLLEHHHPLGPRLRASLRGYVCLTFSSFLRRTKIRTQRSLIHKLTRSGVIKIVPEVTSIGCHSCPFVPLELNRYIGWSRLVLVQRKTRELLAVGLAHCLNIQVGRAPSPRGQSNLCVEIISLSSISGCPLHSLLYGFLQPSSHRPRFASAMTHTDISTYRDQGYESRRGHVAYDSAVFGMKVCLAHTD